MHNHRMLFLWLITACVLTAPALHAQTDFHLEAIAVDPASPTEQDAVALHLIGNLSSTGASITSASATVNGFAIEVVLTTQSTSGLSVLVPHTEIIALGLLPAGTYAINIAGAGVHDMASPGDHQFTVSGGDNACDSVTIANVQWAPFTDTALVVQVHNASSTLFGYPGFLLLDDNGDTLAQETVDLFGIAGASTHTLRIPVGTDMPASPFDGTLQLWTGFFSELACSWPLELDLCPPDSCSPLLVQLANFGGANTEGTFTYSVLSDGTPVASGSFTLTPGQQADQDTVCLPPGDHVLRLTPPQGPVAGQPYFGVAGMQGAINGPAQAVSGPGQQELAFTFLGPCADGAQAVQALDQAGLVLSTGAGQATLVRSDGKPLGLLRVFDPQGRVVRMVHEPQGLHRFRTEGWAAGAYILHVTAPDGPPQVLRVVIAH